MVDGILVLFWYPLKLIVDQVDFAVGMSTFNDKLLFIKQLVNLVGSKVELFLDEDFIPQVFCLEPSTRNERFLAISKSCCAYM